MNADNDNDTITMCRLLTVLKVGGEWASSCKECGNQQTQCRGCGISGSSIPLQIFFFLGFIKTNYLGILL